MIYNWPIWKVMIFLIHIIYHLHFNQIQSTLNLLVYQLTNSGPKWLVHEISHLENSDHLQLQDWQWSYDRAVLRTICTFHVIYLIWSIMINVHIISNLATEVDWNFNNVIFWVLLARCSPILALWFWLLGQMKFSYSDWTERSWL